jgi:hypothetical protein
MDQTITPSELPSWRDGTTREAIVTFVQSGVVEIPRVVSVKNDWETVFADPA